MRSLIERLQAVAIGTAHPEQKANEVFICYADQGNLSSIDVPGKRLGTQVFTVDGTEVTKEASEAGIRPVFADAHEHAKRYSEPPRYLQSSA